MDDTMAGAAASAALTDTSSPEWRNIQDVVRRGFARLFAQAESQGAAIKRLEAQLADKLGPADLQAGLVGRPAAPELEARVRTLERALVDVEGTGVGAASSAASATLLEDLNRGMLELRASARDMTMRVEQLERRQEATATSASVWNAQLGALKREHRSLADLHAAQWKAEASDIKAVLGRKLDAADLAAHLDAKADTVTTDERLARAAVADDVERAVAHLAEQVEHVREAVQQHVDAEALGKALDRKADRAEVEAALARKADAQDVSEQLAGKISRESVAAALQRKANRVEVDEALAGKAAIADVNAVLARKADSDTVLASLNLKASKTEVTDLVEAQLHAARQETDAFAGKLAELEKALASKLGSSDLTARLKAKIERAEVVDMLAGVSSKIDAALRRDMTEVRNALTSKAASADVARDMKRMLTRRDWTEHCRKQAEETERGWLEVRALLDRKMERRHVNEAVAVALERLQSDLDTTRREVRDHLGAAEQTTGSTAPMVAETQHAVASLTESLRELEHKLHRELPTRMHEQSTTVSSQLHQLQHQLDDRLPAADVRALMQELASRHDAAISELESHVARLAGTTKATQKDMKSLRRVVGLGPADDDSDAEAFSASVASPKAAMAAIDSVKDRLAAMESNIENLLALVNDKIGPNEVVKMMYQYAEKDAVSQLSAQVVRHDQLSAALASKADRADIEQVLRMKDDARDLMNKINDLPVEELRRQLALKADIKDVIVLLDNKAEAHDVQQAVTSLTDLVASQPSRSEWIDFVEQQVQGKHGVPWNVQAVNADPDNFGWVKDRATIKVKQAGLYEVSFGFYARKLPTVQLLLNKEPLLSAVNSTSYAIHHSSGKVTRVTPHSAGNVVGLTLLDFITIPANASLAISYAGQAGEGFFALRRL